MNQIDIEAVIAARKRKWLEDARGSVTIQERIAVSVPWWLIIIFLVAFALSASHTAGTLSRLSNMGYLAPAMIEFGLLWAAFARVLSRQGRFVVTVALRLLELVFITMAVVVNFSGSLTSVAAQSDKIKDLSFGGILAAFGSLNVQTQTDLIIVPLFAIAIPAVTWVVGEGLAGMFLEQRKSGSLLEEKWREVEREEIRQALYIEFVKFMEMIEARRRADQMSRSLSAGQQRTVSAPIEYPVTPDRAKVSAMSVREVSAPRPGRNTDARQNVRDYLSAHPEIVNEISVRKLAEACQVSKTIAGEVLKEWKEA